MFKIGFLEIHTYGVFVAIGFLAGLYALFLYSSRVGIYKEKIEFLVFWVFVSGFIGARLFYVLISMDEYRANPADIFKIWEGGLVFMGGLFTGSLATIIFTVKNKLSLWKLADAFAPALAVSQMFGRIGCFFAGCCYGIPTYSPIGVVFPEGCLAVPGVKLIPTQLISAFALFIIFLILVFFWKKKKFDGQIFSLYLLLYSVKRFAVEFFRGDFRGEGFWGLTFTQVIALILFITGVLLWKLLSRTKTGSV